MWMLASTLLTLSPVPPQDPSRSLADELADPVRLVVGDAPIDCAADVGHAGPALHDLDGDGRRELLGGNFRGHIDVYERDEASTSPAWRVRGRLKAAGEDFAVPNW